jgi:hypothetical protein
MPVAAATADDDHDDVELFELNRIFATNRRQTK